MLSWCRRGEVLSLEGIALWYESFGEKKDPCFLLIMGGGCQGILWPEPFCKKLASFGFFVIRFDLRDTGRSSYFDYKQHPYTLLDMAKDATLLLDSLGIQKAHVMGTSMGGAIAQIMATHFPSKVMSLTLIASTVDLRNLVSIIRKAPLSSSPLSFPSKECIDWIESFSSQQIQLSWIQKIRKQMEGWKMLNGSKAPFDKAYYGKMMLKSICRQRSYRPLLNHVYAIVASVDLLLETLGKIKIPSLVIQGKEDPIFPKDHAEFLAASFSKGQLLLVDKMGHNLNSCFHDVILEKVRSFVDKR